MNAREARKFINAYRLLANDEETKEAFRTAYFALCHEEVMERIADLEAQEESKLTREDLLHIKVQTETLEHLLHHLPDDIVDHIGFICECEMKERYEARKNEKPVEGIDWEQIEWECEA